ncbi:MAG: hypothetical protein K0Q57_704 [Gammaproteobacteria bacterium]|nr:hypothetical protein [Gammaproteobacteria bacterium]
MRYNTTDMMVAIACTLLAFYMGPVTVYQFATCSGGRAGIAKAKELGCDPKHLSLEDAASCPLLDLSSCRNETISSLALAAADDSFNQVKTAGAIAVVAVGIFAVAKKAA